VVVEVSGTIGVIGGGGVVVVCSVVVVVRVTGGGPLQAARAADATSNVAANARLKGNCLDITALLLNREVRLSFEIDRAQTQRLRGLANGRGLRRPAGCGRATVRRWRHGVGHGFAVVCNDPVGIHRLFNRRP
jgi:hypothetical protein